MADLRKEKARTLRIGDEGPNAFIPIFYGSIDRVLQGRIEGDFDEDVARVIEENAFPKDVLNTSVEKYKTLPDDVKRYWSSSEYEQLMEFSKAEDIGGAVAVAANLRIGRAVIVNQATAAKGARPITLELRKAASVNLGTKRENEVKRLPNGEGGEDPDPDPSGPVKPVVTPPPPGTRYTWDLTTWYCSNPYESFLGDDLYCVHAALDGTPLPPEVMRQSVDPQMIPFSGATEDIDAGDRGNWPTGRNRVYGSKDPQGLLYVAVDVYEKDYGATAAEIFARILAALAIPVSVFIGGPTAAFVGVVVKTVLETIRSDISKYDDDNYVGQVSRTYSRGAIDLTAEVGRRTGLTLRQSGADYYFGYAVNEIRPS